mgnify:CR=1 FL=1
MKQLFFISILFLTSLSITAQESFNGIWKSENSSYVTTILASEYAVNNFHKYTFL